MAGKFCERQYILFLMRSREHGDILEDGVNEWKEKLASLCEGYRPGDILTWMKPSYIFESEKIKLFLKKAKMEVQV